MLHGGGGGRRVARKGAWFGWQSCMHLDQPGRGVPTSLVNLVEVQQCQWVFRSRLYDSRHLTSQFYFRTAHGTCKKPLGTLHPRVRWPQRRLEASTAVNGQGNEPRHPLHARPSLSHRMHSLRQAARTLPPSPMCLAPCVCAIPLTICARLTRDDSDLDS